LEPTDKLQVQLDAAARALAEGEDAILWSRRLAAFLEAFENAATARAARQLHPAGELHLIRLAFERVCYSLVGRLWYGTW